MSDKWNRIKTKFKESKGLRFAVVALLIMVVLIIYFSSLSKTDEKPSVQQPNTSAVDYARAAQENLAETVSKIKGVGKVKALINFESTPEIIIAYITSTSGNNVTSSPQILMVDGSQIPLILKTVYPKALGAIVVAEGASNTKIKLQILEATSTALGISSNLINVYPM